MSKINKAHKIKPGRAFLDIPNKIFAAGDYVSIPFVYICDHPIDDSGYVRISFRYATDMGTPQFTDPKAPNYCSIQTDGDCRIIPRWDGKGNTRPWSRTLYLQIRFGYLDKGQQIRILFGDRSQGSPGWRLQTFCERTFCFLTEIDPIATYVFKNVSKSPEIEIIPSKPDHLICIAPSMVQLGKKFNYHVKINDAWGNPVAKPKRHSHQGFNKEGVHYLSVRDASLKSKGTVKSNPISVVASLPDVKPFWADFHGQSEETVGTNSVKDYFSFARDMSVVDIAAHQGNDFQITDEFWEQINQTTRKFYRPGNFVTFPGYEWSGNTPLGGDRNVFFLDEGGPITRSCRDQLPGEKSKFKDSPTAKHLFKNLSDFKGKGATPFAFAHVGGRYADVTIHDERHEIAVEPHSAWGTFEWLLEDAFRLGYRVGICANSDGHKGRPGASYPGAGIFGSLGGLTCVHAKSLDRKSVHEALRARHFYGTTGNRMLIDVALEDANGRCFKMGDIVHGAKLPLKLTYKIAGTAALDRVEIRNAMTPMRTLRPFGKEDLGRRIKLVWSGAEVRGRNRMVAWDGGLSVQGNSITKFTPINFWNPARPMQRISKKELSWQSVTTGGVAGVILEFAKPNAGKILVKTRQKNLTCPVSKIGLKPKTWKAGGLAKQIQATCLPDKANAMTFEGSVRITKLKKGDNPIYLHVSQEDGHMAWTSPTYIVHA